MALEAAVEEAMREHARAGVPAYVWRDGKVVEITPAELRAKYLKPTTNAWREIPESD